MSYVLRKTYSRDEHIYKAECKMTSGFIPRKLSYNAQGRSVKEQRAALFLGCKSCSFLNVSMIPRMEQTVLALLCFMYFNVYFQKLWSQKFKIPRVQRLKAIKISMPNKMYLFDIFTQTHRRKKDGFSENTDEGCGVLRHNINLPSIVCTIRHIL